MKLRWTVWSAIVLGVGARLLFALAPGRAITAPWSGGSDGPAYVLLARNVASGRGFSYAGMPDAIRPPIYPLILAGLIVGFGRNFAIAVRILQLLAGLLTS